MSTPWILVGRHLRAHWLRTALTVASLVFTLFLFCFLVSIVTTLQDVVKQSATNRLFVQSAVSLFQDIPLDYQSKIDQVPGTDKVTKFQWFGSYYKDRKNFLAQFGVDHELFLDMYRREMDILGPDGTPSEEARQAAKAALAADRRACIIGEGLVRDPAFGWKVGDTVPIQSTFFSKTDGSAWDFNVVAVYHPLKANFDDRQIFFRYDYLDETRKAGQCVGSEGVGVFVVNVEGGHDSGQVIADIDGLFSNGPQRTMTMTEAAFQALFVSMMGNVPFFLGAIGGAVVFAVVFSVVNTMLMSARQRTHEVGILKALGYSDRAVGSLLLVESLVLSLLGGGLGVLVAVLTAEPLRVGMGKYFPQYSVHPETAWWGLVITAGVGLIAGLGPALAAARLRPVQALRSEG
jgi:putative ABC transport system permease protein